MNEMKVDRQKATATKSVKSRYASVLQSSVPHSRNGKHHDVVHDILSDLAKLSDGRALRIPLHELDSKEKVRSALNRETRKRGLEVQTASDELCLYVWMRPLAAGRD